MLILPTRGRPASLRRFIDAYRTTEAHCEVMVIIDHDDKALPDYIKVMNKAPSGFFLTIMQKPYEGITTAINEVFNRFPDKKWYGVIADDVVPETPGWDEFHIKAAGDWNIAWGNDKRFRGEFDPICHPFIGGELVRALGWISYPKCKHMFVDNVWRDIADRLNLSRYLPEIEMPHKHYTKDSSLVDEIYTRSIALHMGDKSAYNIWRCFELIPTINKVKADMEAEKLAKNSETTICFNFISNKPDNLTGMFKNFSGTAKYPEKVQILIGVDEGDGKTIDLIERAKKQWPLQIEYNCLPFEGFLNLYKHYDILHKKHCKNALFVVHATDETRWRINNWDLKILGYVNAFPDGIFRLRLGQFQKLQNQHYSKCFINPCNVPVFTKKWIDITGITPFHSADFTQEIIAMRLRQRGNDREIVPDFNCDGWQCGVGRSKEDSERLHAEALKSYDYAA